MKPSITKSGQAYEVVVACCACGTIATLRYSNRSGAYRRLRNPYRCQSCSTKHHSEISTSLWRDPQFRESVTTSNIEASKNLVYDSKRRSQISKTAWRNQQYRAKLLPSMTERFRRIAKSTKHRELVSRLNKIRWHGQAYRDKMVAVARNNWRSSEYTSKVVVGIKRRWADAQFRAAISIIQRANAHRTWANKSARDAISNAMKENWRDPEFRTRMLAARRNPPPRASESVIAQLEATHGDKFDYTQIAYVNSTTRITVKCRRCGRSQRVFIHTHLRSPSCRYCRITTGQREIVDFLSSLTRADIVINDRAAIAPNELDIYLPECRLAIEYHGLFYHSFDRIPSRTMQYGHQTKALACLQSGIKLLQVFSNEWSDRNPIIRSMIQHHLHLLPVIQARKCSVVRLSSADQFFSSHHLLGARSARVSFGLERAGELLVVMSFSKHRRFEWEIIRYATKSDMVVIGAASKLFRAFVRYEQPASVMSFADLRYSYGDVYRKMGFEFVKITKPNYFYTDKYRIYSRQSYQKHKLPGLLADFDPTKTEVENCLHNGLRIGYDAGHLQWIWHGPK